MAMTKMRHVILAGGLLVLCAVPMGILAHGGSLVLPLRERAALRGLPAGLATDPLWRAHLDVVEEELEHGRVDAAVRVWRDAYGAALESGNWESMIAVGDAFMAIGRASGTVRGARMNARDAYLTAVLRARRDRSVDGALRSAQAFWEIDDHAVAEQCLRIAAQLAAGDDHAQQRVREGRNHWVAPQTVTEF